MLQTIGEKSVSKFISFSRKQVKCLAMAAKNGFFYEIIF